MYAWKREQVLTLELARKSKNKTKQKRKKLPNLLEMEIKYPKAPAGKVAASKKLICLKSGGCAIFLQESLFGRLGKDVFALRFAYLLFVV